MLLERVARSPPHRFPHISAHPHPPRLPRRSQTLRQARHETPAIRIASPTTGALPVATGLTLPNFSSHLIPSYLLPCLHTPLRSTDTRPLISHPSILSSPIISNAQFSFTTQTPIELPIRKGDCAAMASPMHHRPTLPLTRITLPSGA